MIPLGGDKGRLEHCAEIGTALLLGYDLLLGDLDVQAKGTQCGTLVRWKYRVFVRAMVIAFAVSVDEATCHTF